MTINNLYQLLNPLGFLALAAVFFFIARTRTEVRSAYWFVGAYTFAAIGFTLSFILGFFELWLLTFLSLVFYFGASYLLATGLTKRAGNTVPKLYFGAIAAAAVLSVVVYQLLFPDQSAARISMSLITATLFLSTCALNWSAASSKSDKAVLILFGIFGVSFLVHVGLIIGLGGWSAIKASEHLFGYLHATTVAHNMIGLLCAFAAMVAYGRQLFDLMRSEADTDPLTGLLNRRAFYKNIVDLEARAAADKKSTFLILADLDKFKSVNDLYGHATGDTLIAQVAQTLTENSRTKDIVARIGGEEFLVALVADDLRQAAGIADDMRTAVQQVVLNTKLGPQTFTISMGVSQQLEGEAIVETLGRADEALYLAKSNGRNRVETQEDVAVARLREHANPPEEITQLRDTA